MSDVYLHMDGPGVFDLTDIRLLPVREVKEGAQ